MPHLLIDSGQMKEIIFMGCKTQIKKDRSEKQNHIVKHILSNQGSTEFHFVVVYLLE